MKHIHRVEERTVVTPEGEILQSEEITNYTIPSEPPFVKMYIDDLGELAGIHKGAKGLLHELAFRVDIDGYVSLNPIVRKKIAERLGITTRVLANYLLILKKNAFLYEECRNVFILNPEFFAKGKWTHIYKNRKRFKSLTMAIRYDQDGSKTITTKIEEEAVKLTNVKNDQSRSSN